VGLGTTAAATTTTATKKIKEKTKNFSGGVLLLFSMRHRVCAGLRQIALFGI